MCYDLETQEEKGGDGFSLKGRVIVEKVEDGYGKTIHYGEYGVVDGHGNTVYAVA